jgi:ParB family transcriptional regulator, chromosome partitioning protein
MKKTMDQGTGSREQDKPVLAAEMEHVLVGLLDVAPWNARKTFDPAALKELTESVRQHGIQVPLLARPSTDGARLEIVAGHRRFKVAEALALKTVPCIVREMTDDEARERGLVDNLQREDVPALEEADAYAELQQRLGTATAIAQRVGKDVAYVTRRLQLCELADFPRKALAERLITVDHALLLARLGVDEQDANLKWALNPNSGIKEPVEETIKQRIQERDSKSRWHGPWEPQSVLLLKHHIEEHVGRKLSRAPWSLDDAKLINDVPACNLCPSNTKHNDNLFGDMNIAAATCEDGGCFEMKRLAFVSIKLSEATAKQDAGRGPAVRLSWKATTVKPRFSEAKAGSVMTDEAGVNLMQVFKVGQWAEAKPKSCEHVRLGVTIDWSDANDRGYMGGGVTLRKPGQTLTVCIAPGCKVHKKEWEKPKSENRSAPYDAKAEEEKREKTRLATLAETKLRVRLASAAVEKITKLPEQLLRRFLIDQLPSDDALDCFEAICPGLEKTVRTAALDSVAFAKAVALLSLEGRYLVVREYWEAKQFRQEFISSLKLLGYDASKAWDKSAAPKAEKPVKAAAVAKPKKPILNAAAKKRIAEAQKKRWATAKKGGRI